MLGLLGWCTVLGVVSVLFCVRPCPRVVLLCFWSCACFVFGAICVVSVLSFVLFSFLFALVCLVKLLFLYRVGWD